MKTFFLVDIYLFLQILALLTRAFSSSNEKLIFTYNIADLSDYENSNAKVLISVYSLSCTKLINI